MVVHKPFAEEVKIDGIVLSRLMLGEDLFTSLEKNCQGSWNRKRSHPFSHRERKECGLRKCQVTRRFAGKKRRHDGG